MTKNQGNEDKINVVEGVVSSDDEVQKDSAKSKELGCERGDVYANGFKEERMDQLSDKDRSCR